MIIQCEQCKTKFRLDDSKVKDTGAKVRCARCRHVFSVSKEQQENVQPSDFGAIFDQNAVFIDEAHPFDPFAHHDETASVETRPGDNFGSSEFAVDEQEESGSTIDSTLFDLPEEEPLPVADTDAEFSQFNLDAVQEPELAADEPPALGSEINFDGFDFGDVPEHIESSTEKSAPFSDLAGISSNSAAPHDFNIQLSDFADSATIPGADESSETASATEIVEPFRLGEIDFGDELASLSTQQVNPDDVKGGLDFDFGHLDEPQETTSMFASGGGTPWIAPVQAAPQEPQPSTELTSDKIGLWGPWSLAAPERPGSAGEELSALSNVARRKQRPLLSILFSAAAVFGMATVIYSDKTRTQENIAVPSQAAGKITLSAVDAAFVNNKSAGELLVITGNAVNNFETSRASIQIKGMVYGEKDQVVASKTAYCGNMLTKELLASMPLETIEAAMANQFGSALENLDVAPGKAIPCMVVITKLPEDSKNYGAVLAGSLPAAAKQK